MVTPVDPASGDTGIGPEQRDPDAVAGDLRAAEARLRSTGPPPGRAWCRAWTGEVDAALRVLTDAVVGPGAVAGRVAVAAVGGYGRAELCPNSDVDLLLLHDGLPAADLERFVRSVVYPLWDAGLRVGYAVRDRREAIDAVDEVDSATAVLDLRPVAGDAGIAHLVRTEVLRRLRRRSGRFLASLRAADHARRAAAGDAAEVLEPDLKNGAGGLRDVQSLRWAAAALVGTVGLDPLVSAGYLGAPDRPRLAAAEEQLLAARVALHLVTGSGPGSATAVTGDRVLLELQDPIAVRLGLHDRTGVELAPHRLLRDLYLAARTVDHVHRRAWALIDADLGRGSRRRGRPTEAEVDGFELVDGVLRLPAGEDLDDAALPARLLAALTDTGAVLERGSAARLRRHVSQSGEVAAWPFGDRQRDRLVQTLWRGRVALPALAELDDTGVFAAWLPEWAELRGRPQRNPYHRYALDRHAWHTAAELGELVRREGWAARALSEVEDREALLLGALLHDVGKARGEPHSETGVPLATALARRMGARDGTIARIGELVRLHLLLPDAARKRDVADPALAGDIAAQVGDISTLASLHLLAAADGRATGPTAWSDWTASLVRTLVTKVRAVLDELHPDEVADGALATADEAQGIAAELGADAAAVREHLALLSSRYAAAVSPRAVVRHTLMAAQPVGPTEVTTRVTPGRDDPDGHEGVDELDVVSLDSPGWFAKVAGVVAMHDGSVLAADAFTRADGLAIDTFKVCPPDGVSGSWWARVEGDLNDAAGGRLAVRARVTQRARREEQRVARLPEVPTTVEFAEDPSGRSTVVEVRTLDRVGVLYAIATTLAELELDIVVARIQTLGHEVVDVFYVRDADGVPLSQDHQAEVELGIRAAIAEL